MAQFTNLQLGGLQPAVTVWRALRLGFAQRASGAATGRLVSQQQAVSRVLHSRQPLGRPLVAAAAQQEVSESAAAPAVPQRELLLHNTMTRQKEPFRPRPEQGNRVSMYVCGVTVYDYSHIGHARVYVAFDIIFRFLRHLGYDVTYVRNFTDVDDKIIARAAVTGEDPLALAQRFIDEFHADMETLGCLRPSLEPKATDFIPHMVALIQRIIDNGHAYALGDGDVYFDVASLPGYGKLSGRSQEDNRAGERVAVDSRKRCAADFALWKAAKPGEPTWDSPWGPGRPGWHIECSAMIREVMGEVIDIHGGGRDLVFPHHENELAQSRAAAGPCSCGHDHSAHDGNSGSSERDEFVRYWLHNGFVNVDSEKMSKSLGNFFTIREVIAQYHPRALRWFLVNTQYRQPINYTQRALEEASDRVYYLYQTIGDMAEALAATPEGEAALAEAQQQLSGSSSSGATAAAAAAVAAAEPAGGKGSGKAKGAKSSGPSPGVLLLKEVQAALADDFNTPLAIAAFSAPLKAANDLLHTKKGKKEAGRLQTLASYHAALHASLELLGLWAEEPAAVLAELRQLALTRSGLSEAEVAAAIEERAAARAAKDYAAADAVRVRLESVGILMQDTPQGTSWKPGPRLHIAEEQSAPVAA